jgi:RND superfamily putative drug exporter
MMIRLRWPVLGFWIALLAAGNYVGFALLPSRLNNELTIPGTESEQARTILEQQFGARAEASFLIVATVADSSDRAERRVLTTYFARAAASIPTGRADPLQAAGPEVLFTSISNDLGIERAQKETKTVRRVLRDVPGARVYVSGNPAMSADLWPIAMSDMARGEGIAIPIALLVLVAVFGISLAVGIPFLMAACSIGGTLGIVFLASYWMLMPQHVVNLVELVGLGVAVDYSLLIVYRFREELEREGDSGSKEAAIVRTMQTAGRAVLFSGVTVAIGLGLLLLMPIPFMRAVGLGAFMIPLLSIAAAVTLQPALLALASRRSMRRAPVAEWVRRALRTLSVPLPRVKDVSRGEGLWSWLAGRIMRRPVVFLLAGGAVLVAAAVPALDLSLTPGSMSSSPRFPESIRGYDILSEALGPGALSPTQIVIDSGQSGGTRTSDVSAAIARLTTALAGDEEVARTIFLPIAPYVDSTGRYARITVVGRHEYGEPAARDFVERTRERTIAAASFPPGADVLVGGGPASGFDFQKRLYQYFPLMIAAVLALTYLLLTKAFRSFFLPLKAVILNLLSVGAAYGLLVIVFSWGVGHALIGSIYQQDLIEGWIPVILFAMLFGLSMDYEVFLVTRMREAWDAGATNEQAVSEGLERTGRIVTAAAVIMVAAFSGFIAGRLGTLQELGFGLAAAILFDATIIRAILVPSLMALFGRYNWWLPSSLARIVRAEPSPLVERG